MNRNELSWCKQRDSCTFNIINMASRGTFIIIVVYYLEPMLKIREGILLLKYSFFLLCNRSLLYSCPKKIIIFLNGLLGSWLSWIININRKAYAFLFVTITHKLQFAVIGFNNIYPILSLKSTFYTGLITLCDNLIFFPLWGFKIVLFSPFICSISVTECVYW